MIRTSIASENGSNVRVLIVSTELWLSTARLAMALHQLGCGGVSACSSEASGAPYGCRLNISSTQSIAVGAGRDLVAGYLRKVLGKSDIADRAAVSDGELIALFPQELVRDANSEFVQHAYHDVPWEAPRLMQRALNLLPALITDDPHWRG